MDCSTSGVCAVKSVSIVVQSVFFIFMLRGYWLLLSERLLIILKDVNHILDQLDTNYFSLSITLRMANSISIEIVNVMYMLFENNSLFISIQRTLRLALELMFLNF